MEAQSELTCVACETTFDAEPNGGFCPDCDTPHPDYELRESVDGDEDASENEEAPADEAEETAPADEDQVDDAEADDAEAAEADDAEVDDAESETESTPEPDQADGVECSSCGSSVDSSAKFCPDCGTALDADDAPASDELSACPDCGTGVSDESFCPNCGTNLDEVRAAQEDADDAASDGDEAGESDADAEDDADAEVEDEEVDDEAPAEAVTLVIAGNEYRLEDGDTFGRQNEIWLDDLVAASGGRDEASFISGEHLSFEIGDDGVYLTDKSTNGTSLNGDDLDGGRAKLEDGDTLELAGRAEIAVKL